MNVSAKALIAVINKLISVHQNLNQLAKKKTVVIKNNEIEQLDNLLKEEEKLVLRLKALESERRDCVYEFIGDYEGFDEDITLAQWATLASSSQEGEEWLDLRRQLLNEIADLKQQNKLNQELIEQSLQFVNVSLDLLHPQTAAVNYERPDRVDASAKKVIPRFDSKA